ncbi:DNA-binding response regulator [Eisenbergiella tayi]|uniref:Stage 0 sporulation protein A homolog n=1 Tax=Eisenbergiella tayi TaxID=1432052 RepID=A0A1E3AHF5_9FIRM|nr:response regulator [Eisenbergiella tayi]ODM08155.1 putative response regulatory protein [Eisenbergiella tayi]OIZ64176.1 DNA-binding response regulator [Eisenbergiella tayi]
MYKVAIVDDEPVIVRGLTKMIPWESYNCRVVGTAGDGQEGMKLIREQKPDILISDICMPGIDGLTMIAGMKSEFGHMQITILTGFRDFDYAQQAIRLGVTRFLLKPSKMDELEEAVRVMIENLEKQGITGKEDGTDESVGENTSKAEGNREGEEGKEKAEPSEGKEGEETDSPASCFIVKNALAYIEENYREKLKLSDVADQIYVSQWHLSKLLNKHTGQNFSEILNTIRIEKAKELLKDPSLRIGDIAEEVGFLDVAHFSRVFKKQAGISANEYRNTKLGS